MSKELEVVEKLLSFAFVMSENMVGLTKGDYDEEYFIKKTKEYLDKYYVHLKDRQELVHRLNKLDEYEKVLNSERLTITNCFGSHLIDYKYDDYNRQYDIDRITEKLGSLEDIHDNMFEELKYKERD